MHSIRMAEWKKKVFALICHLCWIIISGGKNLNQQTHFHYSERFWWKFHLKCVGHSWWFWQIFSIVASERKKKTNHLCVCLIQTRQKKERMKLPNKLSFIGKRYYSSSVMDLVWTSFLICAKIGVWFSNVYCPLM